MKMMKYILIFIYLAVSILLLTLNWDLFTTAVVVDMAFGEFNAFPFLILQIFGVIVIGLFALIDGFQDLKWKVKISGLEKTILTLQKDAEIAELKKNEPIKNQENSISKDLPTTTEEHNDYSKKL